MLNSDSFITPSFQLIEPEAIKVEFNEMLNPLQSNTTTGIVFTGILLYEIKVLGFRRNASDNF